MREKLETLPLNELKAMAKDLGIRRTTGIRKAELIESILAAAEGSGAQEAPADNAEGAAGNTAGNTARNTAGKSAPGQKAAGRKNAAKAPKAEETPETPERSGEEPPAALAPSDEETPEAPAPVAEEAPAAETAVEEPSAARTGETTERRQNGRRVTGRNAQGGGDRRNSRGDRSASRSERTNDRGDRAERSENQRQPKNPEQAVLDAGEPVEGILEIIPDGYGFLRGENFISGDSDIYVSPSQIRRFGMRTGDVISGIKKLPREKEKFGALLYVNSINGHPADSVKNRPHFEDLTPIFPDKRIHLETPGCPLSMRIVDLVSPIGKGQRGMIVSPPKAGKTTLLKQIAKAVQRNYPEMNMIVLLIDERPEEVTDFKESISGEKVQVIYSTFDELPEHHKRVTEMVLERAKRLVETGEDVIILLDSITRLSRAYNLTVTPSGRTLSGGLDPAALYMPKKFFGAARNLREGGSLTILATALVDTGSRLDEMVFEEFKGTGNMELALDRRLSERRIFPAIDILKSGTRRDDLLLSAVEQRAMEKLRRQTAGLKQDEATEQTLWYFMRTKSNAEALAMMDRVAL